MTDLGLMKFWWCVQTEVIRSRASPEVNFCFDTPSCIFQIVFSKNPHKFYKAERRRSHGGNSASNEQTTA